MSLFPLVTFDMVDDAVADARLEAWGHWLGACTRPFGRQSFGLAVGGELVSVAVSASTVNRTCGGWPRQSVVELARQCSHPDHRAMTRVCVRLWRELAPASWAAKYWPVLAVVSYSNALRHAGDIYRFDGWTKVADVPGSGGGGTYGTKQPRELHSVQIAAGAPLMTRFLLRLFGHRLNRDVFYPVLARAHERCTINAHALHELHRDFDPTQPGAVGLASGTAVIR